MKKEAEAYVYAVARRNGCLLLVKKGNFWILPGGKNKSGEDDLQGLFRNISQELPKLGLKSNKIEHLGDFSQKRPNKDDGTLVKVFLVEAEGEIMPSCEIKASFWSGKPQEYNLSKITKKIVHSLIKNGYL